MDLFYRGKYGWEHLLQLIVVLLVIAFTVTVHASSYIGTEETPAPTLDWSSAEVEPPFQIEVMNSWVNATHIYAKLNFSIGGTDCSKPSTQKIKILDEFRSMITGFEYIKVKNVNVSGSFSKKNKNWEYTLNNPSRLDCGESQVVEVLFKRNTSIASDNIMFGVSWGTNSSTYIASNTYGALWSLPINRMTNGTLFFMRAGRYIMRSDDDGATWSTSWFDAQLNYNTTYCNASGPTSQRLGMALDNNEDVIFTYDCYDDAVANKHNYGFILVDSATGSVIRETLVNEAQAGNPARAVDAAETTNGTIFVNIRDEGGTYVNCYMVNSTDGGATWGTPIRVSDDVNHSDCGEVHAQGNNVYLLFSTYCPTTGVANLRIAKFNGTAWSIANVTNCDTSTSDNYVSAMALSHDGQIHVTYRELTTGHLEYRNSTDSFASVKELSTNTSTTTTVTTNGADVWVGALDTAIDPRSFVIFKSTDDGATFGSAIYLLPQSGYNASGMRMRHDGNNNPYNDSIDVALAYANASASPANKLYYDRLGTFAIQTKGGSWVQTNATIPVGSSYEFTRTDTVLSNGGAYYGGASTCEADIYNLTGVTESLTGGATAFSGGSCGGSPSELTWNCANGETVIHALYSGLSQMDGGPWGWSYDTVHNASVQNLSRQYWNETTVISANPGSCGGVASTWGAPDGTTLENITGTFITGGGTCNATTFSISATYPYGGDLSGCPIASIANTSNYCYGDNVTEVLPGWTCGAFGDTGIGQCNETITVSKNTDFNMTDLFYNQDYFTSCPGGYLCSFSGLIDLEPGPVNISKSVYDTGQIVTECGTYSDDNTHYVLVNDLTFTNATDAPGYCLIFDGENQSFDGSWYSLNITGGLNTTYQYWGIAAEGVNQVISNISINCNYGANGALIHVNASNSNFSFIYTNGCSYDYLAWGEQRGQNYLYAVDLYNASYVNALIAASVNATINFTNVNAHGTAGGSGYHIGIYSNGSTANYFDNGYNYWANCTGNCSWYTVSYETTEYPLEDTYVDAANPSSNYGTAGFAPTSATNKLCLYKERNVSYPPGRYITTQQFSIYDTTSAAGTFTQYAINGTWTENGTTWLTRPTTLVSQMTSASGVDAGTRRTFSSWVNQTNFGIYGGAYMALNWTPTSSGTWSATLRENVTQLPYTHLHWNYASGNPGFTPSSTVLKKDFLSLYGATYCSVEMPSDTDPRIKYYANESVATTTFYEAPSNNSGLTWFTFPCSANTLYTVETDALTYATTGACVSETHESSVYYFLDEITEVNTTANATVYITMNGTTTVTGFDDIQSFRICMSNNITASVNITTRYENYTSSVRFHEQLIDQNTSNTIYLYLLDTSLGNYYTFQVITSASVPIQGADLYFYKYSVPQDAWVITEHGETDFSGYTTVLLESFNPYILVVTASGYITLNVSYTPTTVTLITIRLYGENGTIPEIPGYEKIWNSTYYAIAPSPGYHPGPVNFSFQVQDLNATSAIQYYGWNIVRHYNGTDTNITAINMTAASDGGILNQTNESGPGTYVVTYWFKRTGYDEFHSTLTVYIGDSSGLALARGYIPGIISPWAYIFIATLVAMIVAGYVSRYTVDGASISGLIIMSAFAVLWPSATISDVGGLNIEFWMITVLTWIIVSVALAYRWVF